MLAAGGGHVAVVRYLLNTGAHFQARDNNERTARDIAEAASAESGMRLKKNALRQVVNELALFEAGRHL